MMAWSLAEVTRVQSCEHSQMIQNEMFFVSYIIQMNIPQIKTVVVLVHAGLPVSSLFTLSCVKPIPHQYLDHM